MSYPTDNFIHNILKLKKADIGIKIWKFCIRGLSLINVRYCYDCFEVIRA